MTEPVTLPPLPGHPEPHTYCWTKLELEEIRAYGKKCFEAGSKQAEVATLPVGMVEPIAQFIASQEPLGAEFSKVLHDNLDSLYETKEPTK